MKEKIREGISELRKIWEGIIAVIETILGFIFKIIGILIIIALLIYAVPKIIDFLRIKTWTLFLYSTETPDTDYLIQRIDGYKTQTECLEKGFNMSKNRGSYECGYDCRYRKEYGVEICDKVCSKWGCRD
ncbi:hypothetical protein AMJ49_04570 [Parcubacteria bacterium DG_74_2]|nr:MAG: hypothetical protein AMJ49_04570 [Parcubacteria bacterium DG_74_2]